MRDWRSGIVTVTVRDARHREHDPILGVVPLRLSDILQTSSQVTRWYPLDGGIGEWHPSRHMLYDRINRQQVSAG